MIRKLLGGSLLLVLSLLVLGTVGNHKALAFYTDYCDVLASPSSPDSTTAANCQNGQNNNGLTGLNTSTQSALKSSFISKIENYRSSGYGFQKVGAAYIESHLQARGGTWTDNINNPAVTLSIGSIPDTYACENTAYYAPGNYVTGTGDCAYGASSLLIYESGVLVYIIKIDCGNPMGNLAGPSAYSPPPANATPTGNVVAACMGGGSGQGTITATFADADGPTTAYVTVLAGTPDYTSSTASSSPATWNNVPAANAAVGSWGVNLYVKDVGPAGSGKYVLVDQYTAPRCDQWPTGTANFSCSTKQIVGTAWDRDDSAANASLRVYIYDGSTYLGQTVANQQEPGFNPPGNHYHQFTYSLPASYTGTDWQSKTFTIKATSLTPSGVYVKDSSGNYAQYTIATPSGGPCASVSCGTSTFGGLVVGQHSTFTVNVKVSGVTTGPPASATPVFAIVVVNSSGVRQALTGGGPPPTWAPVVGHDYGGTYSSGVITSPTNSQIAGFTPLAPGAYQVLWSYNVGGSVVRSCNNAPPVQAGYAPYFNVLGGDVAAGPGFGACSPPSTPAGIFGSNKDTTGSGPFYGAGTQLGAFALSNITSFATSQNPDGSSSGVGVGSGLAFANSANGTIYGGNYGKGGWCVPDYAANATAHATVVPSSGTIDVNALQEGVTYVNGDTIIHGNLPLGRHATLVVKGDVFIDGNITYTAYTQTADIPQFRLLVTGGSIYIGNTVSELHGFYADQPASGAGGTIYTCAIAMRMPVTGANLATDYGTCNHPLTIYGGVAADSIKFGRTYGSLTAAGGVTNQPAEKIVFTPELWLSNLSGPSDSCTLPDAGISGCAYQGFTGLPPVL